MPGLLQFSKISQGSTAFILAATLVCKIISGNWGRSYDDQNATDCGVAGGLHSLLAVERISMFARPYHALARGFLEVCDTWTLPITDGLHHHLRAEREPHTDANTDPGSTYARSHWSQLLHHSGLPRYPECQHHESNSASLLYHRLPSIH